MSRRPQRGPGWPLLPPGFRWGLVPSSRCGASWARSGASGRENPRHRRPRGRGRPGCHPGAGREIHRPPAQMLLLASNALWASLRVFSLVGRCPKPLHPAWPGPPWLLSWSGTLTADRLPWQLHRGAGQLHRGEDQEDQRSGSRSKGERDRRSLPAVSGVRAQSPKRSASGSGSAAFAARFLASLILASGVIPRAFA